MRAIVILGALGAYLVWKLASDPDFIGTQAVGYQPSGDTGTDDVLGLTLIVGEIIVFVFYWFKFNEWAGEGEAPAGFRPRPVRHFTTWLRFLGWNCTYGLLMAAAYTVIVFFPDLIYEVAGSFLRASNELQAPVVGLAETQSLVDLFFDESRFAAADVSTPADLAPYAVVLVTVLWAGTRPFSDFERRFRLQLQERAAVPTQARDLIESFSSNDSSFSAEKEVARLAIEQSGRTLGTQDFINHADNQGYWLVYARVEYIYTQLQRYWSKPVFSNLSVRYAHEFEDIESRVVALRSRIRERIQDVQQHLDDEGVETPPNVTLTLRDAEGWLRKLDQKKQNALRDKYFGAQHSEIERDVNAVWRDILQLLVCSILAVGRTPTHRAEMFEAFGFNLKGQIPLQLNWETVTWIAFGTLGIVFSASMAYRLLIDKVDGELPPHVPEDVNQMVWWSVVVSCMHLVAIIAGYTVQRSFAAKRERMQIGKPRFPSRSDLTAEASWSALFGVSLNVLLFAVLFASSGNFNQLVTGWWWALVPGVTAFFAAVYTQQERHRQLMRSQRRSFDEMPRMRMLVAQAAATGATAFFVLLLLYHQSYDLSQPKMLLYGAYVGLTNTFLGLALGLILCEWVRAETNVQILDLKGETEKRRNRKKYRSHAEWSDEQRKLRVRTVTISDNGAELVSTEDLAVGSRGQISIPPFPPQAAQVLRRDARDEHRFYVGYIKDAA